MMFRRLIRNIKCPKLLYNYTTKPSKKVTKCKYNGICIDNNKLNKMEKRTIIVLGLGSTYIIYDIYNDWKLSKLKYIVK